MAKIIPRDPEANISISESVSFQLDDKTGFYKKTTLRTRYNHVDFTVKKDKPETCEKNYEIGTLENHDFKFDVTSPSGSQVTVYFKQAK